MIINHNLPGMNAINKMNSNAVTASKSMQKLSSGLRINSAGDDAAGLSISEKMRGQIRGLDQASANAQDGISMVQTAEGALNETTSILQRMRELSNQSANGTNTEEDRSSMQDEINQLTSEVNRIGNTTEFNTQKILNGGISSNDGTKVTKSTGADKTLGAAMVTGTVISDGTATKTLGAITPGKTATAVAAKNDITISAAATGDGAKITVDGVDFDASGITFSGVEQGDNVTNKALLDNLTATVNGVTVKLSEMADVSVSTATATITSKTKGPSGTVETTKGSTAGFTAAVAEKQGEGTSILVDGKEFVLDGIDINKTNTTTKATSITALGNATINGGTTKLSDVADIEFDGDVLKFTSKTKGSGSTIEFKSLNTAGADVEDAKIGLKTADLKAENKQTGTVSTKLTVDDVTFDFGGVSLDSTNMTTSIDALKNITSGGTKLGDLVDIKDNGGKLEFVAKSTGKTSTISFNQVDGKLGTSISDIGTANAVNGADTTVEKAGLQAGKALSSTADISLAANSTFKVAVGSESDVTVTLNNSTAAAVYNTSNSDKNVSKSEMDRLVKDVNSALQDAGLGGKVSASLSADNKIQFISETGKNIEVKDGTNTPLASKLGFTDKVTDMGANKNVQQVVGPGAQGSGYTTSFQIGANKGQSMTLSINDMRAAALGITGNAGQQGFTKTAGVTNGTTDVKQESALNVMTKEDATKSLDVLDKAIASVSAERGKLGAVQNRLEHTINNLGTSSENLTSAESRIRDVDMAKEMSTFSKNNILSQAAQAMLAQANQQPQQVLQLLR